jgi:hypothetical protein
MCLSNATLRRYIAMLCSFFILYAIVAMVGGDGSSHSSPIFIFRLLGFTLPLILIGRAVWLFRRRRQVLVNQMNEILEFHSSQGGGLYKLNPVDPLYTFSDYITHKLLHGEMGQSPGYP